MCGYLCMKLSLQVNTLQQLEVRFPHWRLRCGQMRDFFKYTFGVADLPVGIILFYLKDRLCLSLPPSDAAVNCNKRIWLNEFPDSNVILWTKDSLTMVSAFGFLGWSGKLCFRCCWNSSLPSAVTVATRREGSLGLLGQQEATWLGEL